MWDGGSDREVVHRALGFTEAPNEVPERWGCLGTTTAPCHSLLTADLLRESRGKVA